MATGDASDMLQRLKRALPTGWFPDSTPVLDTLLAGPAWMGAQVDSLLIYIILQTRLATATDINLDIYSADYLADTLLRRPLEADDAYRARIKTAILAPKGTRAAVVAAVLNLTGHVPSIIEPRPGAGLGGWGIATSMGYGLGGDLGSLYLPYQSLITVQRPLAAGVSNLGGWGTSISGYGAGSAEWITARQAAGNVPDALIYSTIAAVLPSCGVAWVKIV